MTTTVIETTGDRPLVLLPVRLETRYTEDRQALRVRIFPDEIHIDALEPQLTGDETAVGEAYWAAVWAGSSDEEALAALSRSIQPRRAAWILERVRPANPADRPQPPASSPLPTFVPFASLGSHPPRARGLPDFFVAVLVADEAIVAAVGGRPIPRELPVGPMPGQRLTADGDESPSPSRSRTILRLKIPTPTDRCSRGRLVSSRRCSAVFPVPPGARSRWLAPPARPCGRRPSASS